MNKLVNTRRDFLKKSLIGLGGIGLASTLGCVSRKSSESILKYELDNLFPRYTKFDPKVPIWCVTPDIDRCIHRFHSSSPFSPSGRYLGLTRISREDRPPKPGEVAEIVLVDLISGEQKIISETRGWDTQLGAQVQWGANDTELFFNDVDTGSWLPYGIKMNPLTGEKMKLDGTIYMVSPDGRWAASTCLRRIGATQAGYGVIVPDDYVPVNKGVVEDDGVYVTNTQTGECRMIASYKRIVEEAIPEIDVSRYGKGDFYGFHVKWNPQSNRIMLVLRYMPVNDKKRKPMLITMTLDGDDIRVAVPASEWADKGGNHPNWHPDGEHVIMNLNIEKNGWMFVQAKYDGTDLKKITDIPANHGHVTLHPTEKYILTDAYPTEPVAFGDGTAPLWLIDLEKNQKKTLVRMDAVTKFFDSNPKRAKQMRVDLHPAWDSRTFTHVAINGVENGTRRVYVADLSELVPPA
ncbi:twin-arginine translocation signal domain-containing protein [candidate division KSB1 bacterium]|nr:twin-arginine translocation signal domain-containing protein [candidate division KSB1 bacterium]